jgi:hypothetical protein
MSLSKVIPIGSLGQISLSEEGGVGSISLSVSDQAGGGSIAGVAKFSASVTVQASAIQLADAGLVALEAKFPSLSAEIAVLKAAMDAEAAKI